MTRQYLLTADLHFDDDPANSYRWDVFGRLHRALDRMKHASTELLILGDLCDRKDRHSAALVQKVRSHIRQLAQHPALLVLRVIPGNHDLSEAGVAFWEFLGDLPRVKFYVKPTLVGAKLFIPFLPTFAQLEGHALFAKAEAVFMHQPITGARDERGGTIQGFAAFPELRERKVYSGDIHLPQSIGKRKPWLTYVGAPHPVRYGDDHPTRFLLLDHEFNVAEELAFRSIRKSSLEVASVEELDAQGPWLEGDRLRVRLRYFHHHAGSWNEAVARIDAWAKERGVMITGAEPVLQGAVSSTAGGAAKTYEEPADVLEAFGEAEALPAKLLSIGQTYLRKARAQ